MKTKFTILFLLFATVVFACEGHLYRLALNQRTFYNPAALCPYCKGSTFLASGFSLMPSDGAYGFFFSGGNDGENRLHGPWDISVSRAHSGSSTVNATGLRYAWRQDLGNWHLALGFRATVLDIKQFFIPGSDQSSLPAPVPVRTNLFDADAGLMLTNQKGFYLGFSVQHLPAQSKILEGDYGTNVQIGMPRNYSLMSGMVIPIADNFDLMPDLNAMYYQDGFLAQPGCMIRHKHSTTIGAGVLLSENQTPQLDIRAGYTSAVFKWLSSVAFSPQGIILETGIVYRFGHDSGPPCIGGTCTPPKKKILKPKKREFDPHQ